MIDCLPEIDWGEQDPSNWKGQGIAAVKLHYGDYLPKVQLYLAGKEKSKVAQMPVATYRMKGRL